MATRAPGSRPPPAARLRRRVSRAYAWSLDRRVVRAGMRYHFGRGGLLSGGVTWSAAISLTAVLTILVNVMRALLGDRPELLETGLREANTYVPGLFQVDGQDGLIDATGFVVQTWWTPVTFISGLVAIWTALSLMTGLRRSIRGMFGLGGAPLPFAIGKGRDLLGFIGLFLAIIVSSSLSSAVSIFGRPILEWLGVESGVTAWLLATGAVLVSGLIDASIFAMLFRLIAGVRVVRRDLVMGSLLGAAGAGLLRLAGTSVIGTVQDPLLASLAAAGTLLLVINLLVRFTLIVAAWTANPPTAPIPVPLPVIRARQSPNYVTRSAPHTLDWPYHSVDGSLLPTEPTTGELTKVDTAARPRRPKGSGFATSTSTASSARTTASRHDG